MHLCASVCCFAARNTKHIPVQQLHPILQLATSTGRSFWRHEMQHRWWMCPSGRKDNRISHINFVSGVGLVRAGWVVKFNLLWLIDSHSPQAVPVGALFGCWCCCCWQEATNSWWSYAEQSTEHRFIIPSAMCWRSLLLDCVCIVLIFRIHQRECTISFKLIK